LGDGYIVKTYDSIRQVMDYLTATNVQNVVIATGHRQKDLTLAIYKDNNVQRIILAGYDGADASTWGLGDSDIVKTSTSTDDTLKHIADETKDYQVFSAIECGKDLNLEQAESVLTHHVKKENEKAEYYHFHPEKTMDFKLAAMMVAKEVDSETDVLEEFIALNTAAKESISANFKKNLPNILHSICYVYSTDDVYSQFNQACATRNYSSVIKTIVATLKELKRQTTKMFKPHYGKETLYRGVSASKINLNEYKKGTKGFWPGFSSTSPTVDVAKNFAQPGGVIFVINLSEKSPHPNVILGPGWSVYPGEDEVLLLPYFSAQIEKVEKLQGYTYIHVKQNEVDSPLSLETDDAWKDKIVNSIIGEIDEEMSKVLADTIDDFNLAKYFQGAEFSQLFNQVFEDEYHQEISQHEKPDLQTLNEGVEKRMIALLPSKLRHTLAEAIHKSNTKNLEIFQKIEQTMEFNFNIHEDHLKKIVDGIFNVVKKKRVHAHGSQSEFLSDTKNQVKQALWEVIQQNVLNERSDIEQYSTELEQTYMKMVTDLKGLLVKRMREILKQK